jgi:ATP synthase subunit 6
MFFSPLEQFTIVTLVPFFLGFSDFSFTNSSLFFLFVFFIAFILFSFVCSGATLLPGFWQSVVELFYEFFYFSIFTENVKKESSYYFPVFFTVFVFVFFSNLLGMVPYSFAVTSHIAVTLALAILAFFFVNFVGVRKHGFGMLSLFLPPGSPLLLAPLLIMIELVSYSFRVVSLALRLFANVMSGHCLLKILAGFA